MRRTSTHVSQALQGISFPIVLSGNCGASVGVAAGCSKELCALGGMGKLGSILFDAHDDYNVPDTVLSGCFDSQALAMMAGECWKGMLEAIPGHEAMNLKEKLVHVGMRDVNDVERQRVIEADLDTVWGNEPEYRTRLTGFLENKNIGPAMIHIDVDSLDASLGQANHFAVPGGLMEQELYECVGAIVQRTSPMALTNASFDPSGEGAGNIARIAAQAVIYMMIGLTKTGILCTVMLEVFNIG